MSITPSEITALQERHQRKWVDSNGPVVRCREDGEIYPCATIRALDALEEAIAALEDADTERGAYQAALESERERANKAEQEIQHFHNLLHTIPVVYRKQGTDWVCDRCGAPQGSIHEQARHHADCMHSRIATALNRHISG